MDSTEAYRLQLKSNTLPHTEVGNTQKMYAVVDGNLPDDLDSLSIFSKVIGHKLSDGSRDDLYLRCRMN